MITGSGANRTYTPVANYNGIDFFTFRVSDNRGATSEWASVEILVSPENDPPVINGVPLTSINSGSAYFFKPTFSDVDGDTPTFSISIDPLPVWASFNPATGQLSGIPSKSDAGTISNIVISVSDGNGGTAALPPFALTVLAVNHLPVLSGAPATSVDADSPYLFSYNFV